MSISAIRTSFTRAKFQSHLDAQPPRKHAGTVCASGHCPLAVYLGKQSKTNNVEVLPSSWRVIPLEKYLPAKSKMLPQWAARFVEQVDASKPDGAITYGRCAEILRNL